MRAIARTSMRTPHARSPTRWPLAAASMHSAWPTAGTAPTVCSARSTPGGSQGDCDHRVGPHASRGRPCLSTTRRNLLAFCGRLPRNRARMKVLMVSWEYPPVVIGGLGRHVYELATALAAAGHEVVVLSRRPSGTDPSTHPSSDEMNEDVRVVAAAQDPHEFTFGKDMMEWTLAVGHSMVRTGLAIKDQRNRPWRPDVVHAHDWLVAHPAIALAEYFDVPL